MDEILKKINNRELIGNFNRILVKKNVLQKGNLRNEEFYILLVVVSTFETNFSVDEILVLLKSLGIVGGAFNDVKHFFDINDQSFLRTGDTYKVKDQKEVNEIGVQKNFFRNYVSRDFLDVIKPGEFGSLNEEIMFNNAMKLVYNLPINFYIGDALSIDRGVESKKTFARFYSDILTTNIKQKGNCQQMLCLPYYKNLHKHTTNGNEIGI